MALSSRENCALVVTLVGWVLAGVVGCSDARWTPRAAADAAAPVFQPDYNPLLASTAGHAGPATQWAVKCKLVKVQVPLGRLSTSQKLWNHLDEEAVGTEARRLLMRNGFRVGIGRPGSWPPIQAILNSSAPDEIVAGEYMLNPLRAMPIKLSHRRNDQTVWYFRADATLAGAFYPESMNYWLLRHAIDPDQPDIVLLQFTPEVRQEQVGFEWRRTEEGLRQVPIYRGWVGHKLAFRVAVSPEHYVVIGPAENVLRKGLIGRCFLVRQLDGRLLETLFVIVPQIVHRPSLASAAG